MCECPGDQCHCEVLTAYARECERAGLMVHNWRDSTGCRNVTSFRYSGTNQVSREDSDDDGDVESADRNDVLLSTDIEELSPTRFVTSDLGDFLPACSPETAEHCNTENDLEDKTIVKKERRKKKEKLTTEERRERKRKERKEKRREKKRQERLKKKKERRRLRRLREKERRERLNKNRKKNKKIIADDDDDDEEEVEEDYGGVVVQQVQGDDGDTRRKLSWSKYEKGKPPPFEFLLNSSPALSESTGQKEVQEEEEEDYQVDPNELEAPINFKPSHSRVKSGSRVPLPLLEGGGAHVKDLSAKSFPQIDSLEVAAARGSGNSDERTSSSSLTSEDQQLPQSQRERRNWKKTRRRNEDDNHQQQQQQQE